jgi:hypothetical protein
MQLGFKKRRGTVWIFPQSSTPPWPFMPAQSELTMKSGVVLEKVCEYLYYNQKHADSKDVSDMDIPPELCLELLIAADFLDGMLHSDSETLQTTD